MSKAKIIYGVGMICFVMYLVLANRLVTLTDQFKLSADELSNYTSNSQVIFSISADPLTDLKESCSITGHAVCETSEPNHSRYVKILLVDVETKKTYSSNTILRYTVLGNTLREQSLDIQGDNLKFAAGFSTLPLSNGSYEIYLYVWENAQNYGLVRTFTYVTKDKLGFGDFKFEPVSTLINVMTVDEKKIPIKDYSSCSLEAENLLIKGWTVTEGRTDLNQQVYIEVTDEKNETQTYLCLPRKRPDVVEAYDGNQQYELSGYELKIPLSSFNDVKPLRYRTIIKNDNQLYTTGLNRYIAQPDIVETGRVDKLDDVVISSSVTGYSQYKLTEDEKYLSVSGWALLDGVSCEEQMVYLEILDTTGEVYTFITQPYYRGDVVKEFKNQEEYAKSGFKIDIPIEDFCGNSPLEYRVVIKNNGLYAQDNWVTIKPKE